MTKLDQLRHANSACQISSAADPATVMTQDITCILADWGTTNLRAWAVAEGGRVIDRRGQGGGLLAVKDRRFAESFAAFCGDWLDARHPVPAILSGMVGSKLGWKEAPYLTAPVALADIGRQLCFVDDIPGASVWIVPGVRLDDPAQPEVMRGEEAQILGALAMLGRGGGVFLLPGTHAKWAIVEAGRLIAFRTYMTGEIYGLLRGAGTIGQLIEGDQPDAAAFRRGVERSRSPDAANLLHSLFSVRTLGLLGGLPRSGLASYLSGLLIGAELQDGARWLEGRGLARSLTLIGSPEMIEAYGAAAEVCSLGQTSLESTAILPGALFSIARAAGLVAGAPGRS
jgi:2-dehydro-3-deoxygalactonokinase